MFHRKSTYKMRVLDRLTEIVERSLQSPEKTETMDMLRQVALENRSLDLDLLLLEYRQLGFSAQTAALHLIDGTLAKLRAMGGGSTYATHDRNMLLQRCTTSLEAVLAAASVGRGGKRWFANTAGSDGRVRALDHGNPASSLTGARS